MDYFAHNNAIVETPHVGRGTRVWAFAHVLPGARIGADCNICDHVFIENDVIIGDRVTIKCGVQVWDGIAIEDDVFVGPNATFTNDPFPRSQRRPSAFSRTIVKRGASIGANATILPGITIGERAMVSAGCVVGRDVPDHAVVVGNPARITGYVDAVTDQASVRPHAAAPAGTGGEGQPPQVSVPDVSIHRLTRVDDLRGSLVAAEIARQLPFDVKRVFTVFDVTSEQIRGEHAHRTLHQFLICLRGRLHLMVDDGTHRDVLLLDNPGIGVHVPPLVWASQYRYSNDAMLLVLASDVYQPDEYIRDYREFTALRAAADAARGR